MILEMMLTTNPHLSRFFLSFTFCIKLLTRGKRVIIPVIRPLLISNRFRWLISWECVSEAWLNVNLKNRTHFKYSSAIITELWAAPLSFNNACISVSSGVILESILETTLTHELIQGTEDELDPFSFVDCSIYFSFLRILHPFVWNPS